MLIKLDLSEVNADMVLNVQEGHGSIHSTGLHEADESEDDRRYNIAIDAIEAVVLAHACAGVDVNTPAYLRGVIDACHACANNL